MRGGVCATQGMKVVLKVGQSKSPLLISHMHTPARARSHAVIYATPTLARTNSPPQHLARSLTGAVHLSGRQPRQQGGDRASLHAHPVKFSGSNSKEPWDQAALMMLPSLCCLITTDGVDSRGVSEEAQTPRAIQSSSLFK